MMPRACVQRWKRTADDGIPRSGGAWQVVTDGGKYSNAIRRQPMKKKLELLCNYLKKMDMKMIQKEQKRLCMILRKRIQKMQKNA